MWGTYETEEFKEGVISIGFVHSKQKIRDKKQIKMGIGVANGVMADTKVLSGNKDDKTYNSETLEYVEDVLERLNIPKEDWIINTFQNKFYSDIFDLYSTGVM